MTAHEGKGEILGEAVDLTWGVDVYLTFGIQLE